MDIQAEWKGGMSFRATSGGHDVAMDSTTEFGGRNEGPSPKSLLLVGLAGCTGMDVISILAKMRIFPDAFSLDVSADQTEEQPRVFRSIRIAYRFRGNDLPEDKLRRAVELSQERYCGVSAMLSKTAAIDWVIETEPVDASS